MNILKKNINLKYAAKDAQNNYGDELFTVKFRYKHPKENESIAIVHNHMITNNKTTTDFNFAASVAWFGMQLRNSAYTSNKDTTALISLAKKNKGLDEQGYRAEFIRLIETYNSTDQ